jgi:uncharacterized membrane protein YczE
MGHVLVSHHFPIICFFISGIFFDTVICCFDGGFEISSFVVAETYVAVGYLFVGCGVAFDVLFIAADGLGVVAKPKEFVALVFQRHNYNQSSRDASPSYSGS